MCCISDRVVGVAMAKGATGRQVRDSEGGLAQMHGSCRERHTGTRGGKEAREVGRDVLQCEQGQHAESPSLGQGSLHRPTLLEGARSRLNLCLQHRRPRAVQCWGGDAVIVDILLGRWSHVVFFDHSQRSYPSRMRSPARPHVPAVASEALCCSNPCQSCDVELSKITYLLPLYSPSNYPPACRRPIPSPTVP